jgi:hypothetical protein
MTQNSRSTRYRNASRQYGQDDRDTQGRYAPYNPGRRGHWQPDRGWSDQDRRDDDGQEAGPERSWTERSWWDRPDTAWQSRNARDDRGWDTRGWTNRDYDDRDNRDYYTRDANSQDWPRRDWSGPSPSSHADRPYERDRYESPRSWRGSDEGSWRDRDVPGSNWPGSNWQQSNWQQRAAGFERDGDWRPLYGQGSGDADYGAGSRGWSETRADRDWSSPRGYEQDLGRGNRAGWLGRGPKGYQRSDDRIKEDISERLMHSGRIDASDVSVQVQSGKVTLEGTVPDRRMRHAIEDLIDQCIGVKDIDNRVRVNRDDDSQTRKATSGSSSSSSFGAGSSSGSTAGAGANAGTTTTGSTRQRDRDNG